MDVGRLEPLMLEVPEQDLHDLERRLRGTRLAADYGNADWTYGVERGWLEQIGGLLVGVLRLAPAAGPHQRVSHYCVSLDGIALHIIRFPEKAPRRRCWYLHTAGPGPSGT